MSSPHRQQVPPPLWRNASFHLLWSSTFASGFGDRLAFFIALALLGFAGEGQDDSSIVAGLDFFFFLPYLLWSPIAGWLTDRLPRRMVLLAADEIRGVIVLCALFLIPAGHTGVISEEQHWKVFAYMALIGMMAATFVPAKLAIVPGVVGDGLLTRANGAVVTMGIIGNLVGFLIGGDLAQSSIRAAIILCAGCYMVSGVFWAFMKVRWETVISSTGVTFRRIFHEIYDGILYALKHWPVLALIITAAVIWTSTSIYLPALAAINKVIFEGDQQTFGYMAGGLGIGMILGAILLAAFNTRLGNEIIMVAGLAGCGLCIGLQMVIPIFWISMALSLGTGICASMILVPLNTLIQRITPNYIRGRVFAAKEIMVEFGKVVLSLVVWQVPGTDPLMRPAAGVLAVGLLVLAGIGFSKYLLRGPIASRTLNFWWRFSRLYSEAMHKLQVTGRHHVPLTGPVVLLANHTSGIDPTLIQSAIARPVSWMMAKEYMLPGLGWFWRRYRPIPVDRSIADSSAAKAVIARLKEGELIGLFPEGRINYERQEALLPLGPGVTLIGRRTDARFVPVYIEGTPRLRHPLHGFFVPSRSRLFFGRPFRLSEEDASDRERALAVIRDHMLELQSEANPTDPAKP